MQKDKKTFAQRVRIRGFINFLKVLYSNRRGRIGTMILIFFVGMALIAPLIAKHDPVNEIFVAGDYAAPVWYKVLPGGQDLSENLVLLDQPGFHTIDAIKGWELTASSTAAEVSMQYDKTWGFLAPGSIAVKFERSAGTLSGTFIARLTKRFVYPYNSPPKKFTGKLAFWAEDVENLESLDIRVYINRLENQSDWKRYPLWHEMFEESTEHWSMPYPAIDSYATKAWVLKYFGSIYINPSKEVFSKPTDYAFQIELLYKDADPKTLYKDIETVVHFDDLNFKCYGNSYGLLGTDHMGRDIFSQLVWGSRISLFVGLLATLLSVSIGLLVGLVSGYIGGLTDELIMRFNDALLVIPGLPLYLVLAMVLGQSIWNLVLIMGLLGWNGFCRVIRAQTLSLKERPFIEAARAAGAGKFYIIGKHILPNVISLVYVSLALSVPGAILTESALSWLGLFDPYVMSWGRMLHDVTAYQGYEKYFWVIPPGLCIAILSLSFILFGYALDEILNPRLRQRR